MSNFIQFIIKISILISRILMVLGIRFSHSWEILNKFSLMLHQLDEFEKKHQLIGLGLPIFGISMAYVLHELGFRHFSKISIKKITLLQKIMLSFIIVSNIINFDNFSPLLTHTSILKLLVSIVVIVLSEIFIELLEDKGEA